jgi:hypothetical protein
LRLLVASWNVGAPGLLRAPGSSVGAVGIDAQSGYESPTANLRSDVDWIRFGQTGIPAAKKAAVLSGRRKLRWLLPYLTR